MTCSERAFNCGKVCGKPLSCGRHVCQRVCHARPCGECPLAGSRSCPCGKVNSTFFSPSPPTFMGRGWYDRSSAAAGRVIGVRVWQEPASECGIIGSAISGRGRWAAMARMAGRGMTGTSAAAARVAGQVWRGKCERGTYGSGTCGRGRCGGASVQGAHVAGAGAAAARVA